MIRIMQQLNKRGIREKLIFKPALAMTPGDINLRMNQYALKALTRVANRQ